MKLSKTDLEEYRRIIRESIDTDLREFAWKMLCHEHWRKLRLLLDKVGAIPLHDVLKEDTLEDDGLNNTVFFSHYDQDSLENIEMYIEDAEKGLRYLQKLIENEKESRKCRVIKVLKKEEDCHYANQQVGKSLHK